MGEGGDSNYCYHLNDRRSNGKRNSASDPRGEIINLHWLNSPIPARQLSNPTGMSAVEESDPDSYHRPVN